jgi:predicted dehydrogenase
MAASTHYGSHLLVAEQWPYWPKVITVPALIKSGTIGPTLISSTSYYYKSMRDNVTSGSVDAATGGLGWRGQLTHAPRVDCAGGGNWHAPVAALPSTAPSTGSGPSMN